MHHKTLSNLEEEYLEYHDKLQHTPHADIFNLCRYGHLPRKCLKLEKKHPPYASCIIGNLQRLA